MTGPVFEVFSLFPGAIEDFVRTGLLGKAIASGRVKVHTTDIRDYATDRHRTVDDAPFGGGPGMVMKLEPVVAALEDVEARRGPMHRILLTPSAPRFDQRTARELVEHPRIALLCGRYEGIDDRVREHYVDQCLSIGDYVLNGGEVAALAIIEAVSRLCEGVIGNPESAEQESHAEDPAGATLEYPHYTRPAEFRGHRVPAVLTSGDHQAVAAWRRARALERTWSLRPDLRQVAPLAHPLPLYVAVPTEEQVAPDARWVDVLRHHGVDGVFGYGPGAEAFSLRWAAGLSGRVSVTTFRDLRTACRVLKNHHHGAVAVVAAVADDLPDLPPQGLLDRLQADLGDLPAVAVVVLAPPDQVPEAGVARFALPGKTPPGSLALPARLIESPQPWSDRVLVTLDRALAFVEGMWAPARKRDPS